MYVMRQIRIIKHWYRATKQPESLMYKMMYLTGKNGTLINSWSNNVVDLLSRLGLAYLWNIRNVSLPSLNTVIQRIRIGTTKLGL